MPHVASTLTADNRYTEYKDGGADMPTPVQDVLIKGGIGVANKMMVTPTGAILTEVTDEQVEMLQRNQLFQMHEKGGFVKIIGRKVDGDKLASDMVTRDGSAPLTPSHFAEKNKDDPTVLSVNSGSVA